MFSKLTTFDEKLRCKIRKIYKFDRRLNDPSIKQKITQFGLISTKKSKREGVENHSKRERKMSKLTKINLIQAFTLKSNAKWQKIRRKTHNLTQNHSLNDPINHRIKPFYSKISYQIISLKEFDFHVLNVIYMGIKYFFLPLTKIPLVLNIIFRCLIVILWFKFGENLG